MDMDVRLLEALSNLSFALEQIAESLKDGASAKSDVAKALSGGDFFKVINNATKTKKPALIILMFSMAFQYSYISFCCEYDKNKVNLFRSIIQ